MKINQSYINEIDHELETLNTYIDEQTDIKSYLNIQINMMKKIKEIKLNNLFRFY